MTRRRLPDLGWIALGVVGVVPVMTELIVRLGPAPYTPAGSTSLRPDALAQALSEPTDRLVLAAWWITAAVAAVAVAFLFRRAHRDDIAGMSVSPWVTKVLPWVALPGLVLVLMSALWHFDPGGRSPDIGVPQIALGVALALGMLMLAAYGASWTRAITALGIGLALALYVPAWIQTSSRLHEAGHAVYTLDELAAPAAGHIPLHDYVAQYTNLLGYPVAPFIRMWPEGAVGISIGWMICLQAVALILAVALVGWHSGRRALGMAALIVPALVFAEVSPGISASSYFAVMPLRVVLPVVTLVLTAVVLASVVRGGTSSWWWLALVGLASGLTVLNNPDFGLPALIAVVLAVAAVLSSWRRRVTAACVIVTGAIVVFLLYWGIAAAFGHAPDWGNWLLYQRLFGAEGFLSIPMTTLGWHVGMATLFIAAAVSGFALVLLSRDRPGSRRWRQGVAVMLVGTWAVLTLPYFAGRSLPSTVIGGYSLQVGWVASCLLPLLAVAWRGLRARRSPGGVAMPVTLALGLVAVGWALTGVWLVPAPGDVLNRPRSGFLEDQKPIVEAAIASAPASVRAAVEDGEVTQMLTAPSLAQFGVALPSASIFNSPEPMTLSTEFTRFQCEALRMHRARFILVESAVAPFVASDPTCGRVLDGAGRIPLGPRDAQGKTIIVAIPYR